MIAAWPRLWLERLPLTLPMLAVGIGYALLMLAPDLVGTARRRFSFAERSAFAGPGAG